MATLFCETCRKESNFLPLYLAAKALGVCGTTMYYWIERGWVHWIELPSGRRLICAASLSRRPGQHPEVPIPSAAASEESVHSRSKVSNPVR